MRLRKIVAQEIYNIREDLDIPGDQEHDWWLAGQFLDMTGKDRWDEDTIYVWFIQLDENLVKRDNNQEETKWD